MPCILKVYRTTCVLNILHTVFYTGKVKTFHQSIFMTGKDPDINDVLICCDLKEVVITNLFFLSRCMSL